MVSRKRTIKLTCAFVLLLSAVAVVSAHGDDAASPAASQLPEQPGQGGKSAPAAQPRQLSDSPDGDHDDMDMGSISSPQGGSDAKTILANSKHTMGGSDDATDGDQDAKDPQGGGKKRNSGHNGQCVTQCASKSTEGAGCGTDLSKPDCFCKAPQFVEGTFACINVTCPQQFHGAAGVIKSICSVAGAPDLQIPGYSQPDNLENMPTINDDPKPDSNAPAAGGSAPGGQGGATSTFTMPVSKQTPNAGSTSPSGPGSSSSGPGTTSAAAAHFDMLRVISFTAAAVILASAAGAFALI